MENCCVVCKYGVLNGVCLFSWGLFKCDVVCTQIGFTWSMLSSDDLDVMQTFLMLVTCDVTFYDDREDDGAAFNDDGGDDGARCNWPPRQ